METVFTFIGAVPPEGYEFLEYIVRSQMVMVFAGSAVGLVGYLIAHLIDMAR